MARAHGNPRGRKHCAESLLTLWHNILRRHTRPQGELPAQRRCGKSSDAEPAGERFASVCLEKCSSAAVLHFSRRSGDHLEHLHFQLSHNPLGWPASQPMTYFKTRTSGSPVSTSRPLESSVSLSLMLYHMGTQPCLTAQGLFPKDLGYQTQPMPKTQVKCYTFA